MSLSGEIDLNKDGHLSSAEQIAFFERFVKEIAPVISGEGIKYSPEEIRDMFSKDGIAKIERDMSLKPHSLFPNGVEQISLEQANAIAPVLNKALTAKHHR